MPPKHRAAVAARVLGQEVCYALQRKYIVFDQLRSDISYGAVGHELKANESTVYIK